MSDENGKRQIMGRGRLEAFSDGVLAIIITIMVLELKQPVGDSLDDLMQLSPVIIAYLISFMFISIYWVNHHLIFHLANRIDIPILWCNIIWLLVMSFIPFTTAWVGTYPNSYMPLTLYFAVMFIACIAFHVMYYLIICKNCGKESFHLDARSITSIVVYFMAAVIGGYCPIVSYIVVAVVSAWWIFPAKDDGMQ